MRSRSQSFASPVHYLHYHLSSRRKSATIISLLLNGLAIHNIRAITILFCPLGRNQKRIKHWIKPAPPALISGLLSGLTRSRTDLVVENALCASN
jgi:hypothetical protein